MTQRISIVMLGIIGGGVLSGCRDNSPPPPRVPVPTAYERQGPSVQRDEYKPLPPMNPVETQNPLPFDDVPLLSQQLPEQPQFVESYRKVGSPRIVLFINRTLEGNIAPLNPNDPVVRVDRTRINSSGRDSRSTEVYLRAGQYDEVAAKSLDYEAIENIMTDWLSCNGQVTIISPTMARQRLSDQQVKELQEGRPQVTGEIVQQLGADIFVQVQAHPTRQTQQGLEVRIIAEAMNVKGGQSIARAVVDVPPPLEKTTINRYTRFMTRKLIDGMLNTWSAPPAPAPAAAPAPQP